MKEEGNIKFDEIGFPRYVKIKESIEGLMKIINFDIVKEHGVGKVLTAFLQLIDENDDKTVDERYDGIEDAICNGNVFRHYFSEENQIKAVEILSNTALLNDDERLIYIINFYMPNDISFTNVYNGFGKDIDKIAEYYGLTSTDAYNLVYARAAEISKFYNMYKAEKERQKIFSQTEVLAAMQDAVDNPDAANIQRVRTLLGDLADDSLRNTLEKQLMELENDVADFYVQEEKSGKSGLVVGENSSDLDDDADFSEIGVEEPNLLDSVLKTGNNVLEPTPENNVGKEVMASLQSLVAGARESAQKVQQLSLDLEDKKNMITELQEKINNKDKELSGKNKELEAIGKKLEERDRTIEEQGAKLVLLQSEIAAKDSALDAANNLAAAQDEKISSLTTSLNSYKASLIGIQNFLSAAQHPEEKPRKVA